MNQDILKGKWNQIKGSIRSKWGELTNDDVDRVQGDTEKFIGILQEKYGYGREKAESELQEFLGGSTLQEGPPGHRTDDPARQTTDKKRRAS